LTLSIKKSARATRRIFLRLLPCVNSRETIHGFFAQVTISEPDMLSWPEPQKMSQ